VKNLDPSSVYQPKPTDKPQTFWAGVLKAAQHYAHCGLSVFPCQAIGLRDGQRVCTCGRSDCAHPGKHPATANGYHDATRDPEMINQWWRQTPNRNIGLVVGADAGVLVVDVDPRNGGDTSWLKVIADHTLPNDTLIAATGGGGLHIFVEWPTGQNGIRLPSKLAKGIDLRYKGYIIAPPGLHITGGLYRWQEGSKPAPWSWLEPQLGELAKTNQPKVSVIPVVATEGEKRVATASLLTACVAVQHAQIGDRNRTLYKEAYSIGGLVGGSLLDRDAVYKALYEAGSHLLDETFPVEELTRTIDHGIDEGIKRPRYTVFPPEKSTGPATGPTTDESPDVDEETLAYQGPGHDWTERSLARRQLEQIETVSGSPIVFSRGDLYWYDPKRHYWLHLPPDKHGLHRNWHGTLNEKGKKKLDISANRSKAIIECCQQERTSPRFFSQRAPGVTLANGRWHDGQLHPHNADDRALFALSVPFDPYAECPLYDAFLDRVLPDKASQQILIEFMGAAILGLTPVYKIALALVGSGNNGKSQWLNILQGFFPPENVAAIALHKITHEYSLAKLANCALNVVNEISDKDLYDTGPLKALIAGDLTQGRHPTQQPFAFEPRLAFVFATNILPPVHDQTEGFWSRFGVVDFAVTIPKDERIVDYGRKILADEAPGILRRALEGAQTLQKRGYFAKSLKAETTKTEWRQRTDPVSRFVDECLERDETETTPVESVYQHYQLWCYEEGEQPKSKRTLGNKLKTMKIQSYANRKGKKVTRVFPVSLK